MSKVNYKVLSKNGPILSGYYWLVEDVETKFQVKVIGYPFENCQTFLISAFAKVAPIGRPLDDIMDRIREIRDTCGVGQYLCQIDVRKDLFERLKPFINIHASMEYVNLTGNQMVNLLINTK